MEVVWRLHKVVFLRYKLIYIYIYTDVFIRCIHACKILCLFKMKGSPNGLVSLGGALNPHQKWYWELLGGWLGSRHVCGPAQRHELRDVRCRRPVSVVHVLGFSCNHSNNGGEYTPGLT